MGRGLPVRPFPIFASGGVDTKTDPRLLPAGSFLEVENMFYQRTGELRLRNGFSMINAPLVTEIIGLWGDLKGNPVIVGKEPTVGPWLSEQRWAGRNFWEATNKNATAYPAVTCERITGTSGETEAGLFLATSPPSPIDGDVAYDGTYDLHTWLDSNIPSSPKKYATRRADGVIQNSAFALGSTLRPPIAVAGGTARLCVVYTIGAFIHVLTISGGIVATNLQITGTLDSASPWVDAQSIAGGSTILVAWKASGGAGINMSIFDPITNTVTLGPVNIAAADASQTLGLLENSIAPTRAFLVTAGATSGIVCRTINVATLATTATDVIDATATTNVRQVTGHAITSATDYVVHWDVAGTPLYLTLIKRVNCVAGVPSTVAIHVQGFSLYSRSFKAADGRYYFLCAYDSATQPLYILFGANIQYTVSPLTATQMPSCVVFPGAATGRRAVASLTSAWTDSQGRSILSAGRRSAGSVLSQERIAFSFGKPVRTRELGGALYSSGGVVMQNDGTENRWATMVMYLEPVAAVSTAGGSMTAGKTYSYVAVIAENDALGSRIRSAKSVPVSVVISAGHGSATLTLQNPRTPPRFQRNQTIEIYRAGPAEDGDTGYNKVGETYSDPTGASGLQGPDTLTFVDTMSDLTSETGETLYSTGNVLENFVTPSTRLLEVCNQRLWIVSAETTDELWPSKTLKPGTGVNFNPLLAFRVTGDGYGAITALAAMSAQLVVFKSGAIYVISGDGPNDLGQGTFNSPQAVTLSNGTTIPASVLATPDGVLFQSPKGIWSLSSTGGGLTYIGGPVEAFTNPSAGTVTPVICSSLVNGATQARFVMADGRCLVWDYVQKKWTTFLLRVNGSTIVACADLPGGWSYACADGRVYQETPGVFSDIVIAGGSNAIVPAVTFPILATAGINGFARLYAIEVMGEYVGNHTLIATLTSDYDLVTAPAQQRAITAGGFQYEIKPQNQKGTAYRLRLTATLATGSGAFRLSAITMLAATKKGSNTPYTKRLV